jgi:hypothetical protein
VERSCWRRPCFQLGRLITRDDEQRDVEAAAARKVAVHDLVMVRVSSRGARISASRPKHGGVVTAVSVDRRPAA